MPRLLQAPRRGSAALHRHPPASPRFAPLLRAKDLDNALAFRRSDVSPMLRERQAPSKVFDTKCPGAPQPDNRLIHRTRGAVRDSRILLPTAEAHVPLQ